LCQLIGTWTSIESFAIDQKVNLTQSDDNLAGKLTFAGRITNGIDSASPRLAMFLGTRNHSRSVTIIRTKIDPATQQVSSYTISLSDATIESIRQRPANVKGPASKDTAKYEDVAFSSSRIEWIYRPPNGTQMRA
jgi:type VI secretion system Hcp family effector